jgi:hypothetical protein
LIISLLQALAGAHLAGAAAVEQVVLELQHRLALDHHLL